MAKRSDPLCTTNFFIGCDMRTRLTLLCLFINFILVGCAGMPIMGKQSIPVPKSQSLADQEFKKQNKASAIHSQESTIKLASVIFLWKKPWHKDLLQIRQPYQLLAKGRQQKEQPMSQNGTQSS